jgi:hypothetical protein
LRERLVRKIRAGVVSIVFGLGLFVAPVGLVRTGFAQKTAPSSEAPNQTKSRKAYLKHQKKEGKKIKKSQTKAQKKSKEVHATGG